MRSESEPCQVQGQVREVDSNTFSNVVPPCLPCQTLGTRYDPCYSWHPYSLLPQRKGYSHSLHLLYVLWDTLVRINLREDVLEGTYHLYVESTFVCFISLVFLRMRYRKMPATGKETISLWWGEKLSSKVTECLRPEGVRGRSSLARKLRKIVPGWTVAMSESPPTELNGNHPSHHDTENTELHSWNCECAALFLAHDTKRTRQFRVAEYIFACGSVGVYTILSCMHQGDQSIRCCWQEAERAPKLFRSSNTICRFRIPKNHK